jgi:hypothetical protein
MTLQIRMRTGRCPLRQGGVKDGAPSGGVRGEHHPHKAGMGVSFTIGGLTWIFDAVRFRAAARQHVVHTNLGA